MKKLFVYMFVLALPVSGAGELMITEIMYDPSGADSSYEWIEVYNPARHSVNFESYRFREGETSHHVGDIVIPARGFIIIAANREDFLDRYPGFESNAVDSVFSLSNSGELLELLSGSDYPESLVSSVAYQTPSDFAGTGVSIHLDLEHAPTSATQGVWSSAWVQSSTNDTFSTSYEGDLANPGTARWVAEAADRGMLVIIR